MGRKDLFGCRCADTFLASLLPEPRLAPGLRVSAGASGEEFTRCPEATVLSRDRATSPSSARCKGREAGVTGLWEAEIQRAIAGKGKEGIRGSSYKRGNTRGVFAVDVR